MVKKYEIWQDVRLTQNGVVSQKLEKNAEIDRQYYEQRKVLLEPIMNELRNDPDSKHISDKFDPALQYLETIRPKTIQLLYERYI